MLFSTSSAVVIWPAIACRYLFRHNYTDLNVLDVFSAINKPTIKQGYEPYISYREFTRVGSDTDWVEYIATGNPCSFPPRPLFCCTPIQAVFAELDYACLLQ